MTTVEILTRAKAQIDTVGFWQSGNHSSDGVCAVIAIDDVVSKYEHPDDFKAALRLLAAQIGCEPHQEDVALWVALWSDTHTEAEVLAAFDRAIEAAR